MRFSSALLTRALSRRRNLAFLLLLRIMCDVNAWKRFTLPLPVILNRFFALLCVFILGMMQKFLHPKHFGLFQKERKGKQKELSEQPTTPFVFAKTHSMKYLSHLLLCSLLIFACSPETTTGPTDQSQAVTNPVDTPSTSILQMPLQDASEEMLRTLARGGNVDAYVAKFANVPLETLSSTINTDTKRKAFYINLYNAYIQKILTENPDLYQDRKEFFGAEDRIVLAGKEISFDRLEHGIIRSSTLKLSAGFLPEIFPGDYEKALRTEEVDPRIHFAVNCGAKDCPPIHILSPDDLDEELDRMSRAYLNKWTTYDVAADTISTTSLMSWFRGDFGGKDGAKEMLVKYGAVPTDMNIDKADLRFKGYDWTLKTGVYAEK